MTETTVRGDRKLAEAADGRHRTTIMDWVENGCPHSICDKDEKTRVYYLPDVLDWCAGRDLDFYNKDAEKDGDELKRERIRKLKLEANKLEHDEKVRQGLFVPVAEVERITLSSLQQLKTMMNEVFDNLKAMSPELTAAQEEELDAQLIDGFNRIANIEIE